MLRLLCEGHNTLLQSYLREQSSETTNVDLVSEVNELLLVTESEIDQYNIELAHLCIDTLTEFTQGNAYNIPVGETGNIALLLETKLIEVLDRFVQKRGVDGVPATAWSKLRESVATLLMALLEGTDGSVERRLLLRFDLMTAARQCGDLYQSAMRADDPAGGEVVSESPAPTSAGPSSRNSTRRGSAISVRPTARRSTGARRDAINPLIREVLVEQQLGNSVRALKGASSKVMKQLAVRQEDELNEAQEADLSAGFALYILLTHLLDYMEQAGPNAHVDVINLKKRMLSELKEPGLKVALDYYSRYVGSCEIINGAGLLERVFFRFPAFCLYLSDERRHTLVWDEFDRETPGAQVWISRRM